MSGRLQHRVAVLAPSLQEAIEPLAGVGVLEDAIPAAADPWTQPVARQCLKKVDADYPEAPGAP